MRVELDRVETNMVYAELPVDAPAFVTRLRAVGLLVNSVGPHAIRLVCHLDVDRAGCERAADILRASLARGGKSRRLLPHVRSLGNGRPFGWTAARPVGQGVEADTAVAAGQRTRR